MKTIAMTDEQFDLMYDYLWCAVHERIEYADFSKTNRESETEQCLELIDMMSVFGFDEDVRNLIEIMNDHLAYAEEQD